MQYEQPTVHLPPCLADLAVASDTVVATALILLLVSHRAIMLHHSAGHCSKLHATLLDA